MIQYILKLAVSLGLFAWLIWSGEIRFESFQRLGDTRAGDGVGLGLAVARGLIDLVGGTLVAEDTPGGGLTMVVSLPSADQHEAGTGATVNAGVDQ